MVVRNGAELVGYALIIGFLYLVWPPLAALGGGLLLVVWANAGKPTKGRLAGAVAAAAGAAKRAWTDAARGVR